MYERRVRCENSVRTRSFVFGNNPNSLEDARHLFVVVLSIRIPLIMLMIPFVGLFEQPCSLALRRDGWRGACACLSIGIKSSCHTITRIDHTSNLFFITTRARGLPRPCVPRHRCELR